MLQIFSFFYNFEEEYYLRIKLLQPIYKSRDQSSMKHPILFSLIMICSLHFVAAQIKNCNLPNMGNIPITELGNNTYKGSMGGLYPNGKNEMPISYLSEGKMIARTIVNLNKSGIADAKGKIVFIGVGASNPRTEFNAFASRVDSSRNRNQNVVLVNTCIGGQGVQKMNESTDNYWKTAQKQFDSLGLSFSQVQIAWVETDNTQAADTVFPRAPLALVQDLKKLLYTMQEKFPNLKLCYFSARAYSGWVDISQNANIGKGLLAPRDYFNGWAVKWLIDSAIQKKQNFDFWSNSKSMAMPIYANYSYTNGSQVRNDGFSFQCNTDLGGDGLHLSATGEQKIGELMYQFFLRDSISHYWLWQNTSNTNSNFILTIKPQIHIYPIPAVNEIFVELNKSVPNIISLRNMNGMEINLKNKYSVSENKMKIDVSSVCNGIYFLHIPELQFTQKIVIQKN